jgi:hypothetical protein
MNSANDKYGSSLDRTQGSGKPVDPATRLSELLSQSLEELTRPFEAPRGTVHPSRPVAPREEPAPAAGDAQEPVAPQNPEQARADADKALAELEAELFAAAKQVDRDDSIPHEEHAAEHPEDGPREERPDDQLAELERALMEPLTQQEIDAHEEKSEKTETPLAPDAAPAPLAGEPEGDASAVIAKVRRLMLISMAVTVIAVGSVFGFIGYRVMKGEGATAKTADKLPAPPAIPNEVTLSIPRGAKVLQSAVTNDRLVMTLEIDGKVEVRTFDIKTLQPAGRLNFSATP